MGDPLVTVIIPARNEEFDIAGALGSVAAQDYPLDRIELVVVDGGSSDATPSVARDELELMGLCRTEVLINSPGSTPSNLNAGLRWAEGDIVVRVDARSQIPSDYVRRSVDLLMDRPDIAVVGGSQVALSRDFSIAAQGIARALNNRFAMGGSKYRSGTARSGPTDTAYLGVFRTHELASVGGWNDAFPTNQDFELNRRMASIGAVWFEAGLPVSYLPRRSVGELAKQYHRFGRWKVHYWAYTEEAPQPRQMALLGLPGVGLLSALVLGLRKRQLLTPAAVAVATGLVVNDHLGQTKPASLPVRAIACGANVVIGASWWTGVVHEGLMRLVRR